MRSWRKVSRSERVSGIPCCRRFPTFDATVDLCVSGVQLSIVQDNTTMHVGTTVWESSLVLAKWLDKNQRDGILSEDRIKGKRGVELGAGCGIAGMAMALLGCNMSLTDMQPLMPILKKNVKRNISKLDSNSKSPWDGAGGSTKSRKGGQKGGNEVVGSDRTLGKIKTAQLVWGNKKQIDDLKPPFDFIIAADVVYLEEIVDPLIETMRDLSAYDTIIVLGYKLRQEEAHELFWEALPKVFDIQKVAREDLDFSYAFDGVDLFILRLKRDHVGGVSVLD